MAMAKGSRMVNRVKSTPEQAAARTLNPTIHNDGTQAQYELATFRAARKTRSPARNSKGKGMTAANTRGQ